MRVVSRTHVGLVRENNEDALLVREPFLFAIADGMGGYAAGEIASRATIKAFDVATYELRHEGESTDIVSDLVAAFAKANEHVFKMAENNHEFTGMGTTLTALCLPDYKKGYFAHVGDSRLYLFREGVLRQLTDDHTFVADLQKQGKITAEEAFVHPQRNLLLAAMGVEASVAVDSGEVSLQEGDRLLLCTDGLSDMLSTLEITRIMTETDIEATADALLEKSLAQGGRDNISLILIDIITQKEDGADEGK